MSLTGQPPPSPELAPRPAGFAGARLAVVQRQGTRGQGTRGQGTRGQGTRGQGTQGQGTQGQGAESALRLTGISKVYGSGRSALLALDTVSLSVAPGEFVCIIGASGCGKSTLLSLAAGLDTPTAGTVDTAGRRVCLMFQEPALFPWLTAGRNIEIALRAAGVPRAERAARTAGLLETVHLGGFGGKRPHELSGGMRQRVALARALAQDCDVLLMDEPFGALDAMTRDLLHDELERICGERALSVLFVTHNVREAVRLGDRVVVLSSRPGRVIEEYGVPREGQRRIDSVQVAQLASQITDRLREEMSRHVR